MNRYAHYHNLTPQDRQKIARLYREESLSVRLIAERFNLAAETTSRVLREEGVAVDGRNRTERRSQP